jgi:hypothetical protein
MIDLAVIVLDILFAIKVHESVVNSTSFASPSARIVVAAQAVRIGSS